MTVRGVTEEIAVEPPATGVRVRLMGRNALIISPYQHADQRYVIVEKADVPDLIRLLEAFLTRQ